MVYLYCFLPFYLDFIRKTRGVIMVLSEKTKGLEQFNSENLFLFDFSAVANVKSHEELNVLSEFVLTNKIKVAVSREFYENYEVIIKSLNEEQTAIANMISIFLDSLEKNGCLLYLSEIIDSRDIVDKLYKNPKVCFVYYKDSEFSENVLSIDDPISAKAIIVDEGGEFNVCDNQDAIHALSSTEIDISAIDDDYFSTSFEPVEGAPVKTRAGDKYKLGNLLGSGGEGAVFNCAELPDYVIKIYHKGQLNKLRLKKIFLMEKKQIRYDGLCWPEKVIFSEKGEPVGYMMKKICGKPLSAIFDGDETVLKTFPLWKKQNLISLAIDILQKVQYLHLFGILVGDLRMKNIVVDENGNPCIVDIDSCQVGSLPCPIGFPDFTPPELHHVEFKKQLRTYYNESFSCAVLVFKLLYCGLHPYNQRFCDTTMEENVSAKSFPYPETSTGDFSKIPWGGYSDMWKHTPIQMQTFFCNIFKSGYRYNTQEMIMMLKTYNEFLSINKSKTPSSNEISFYYE